MPSPCPTESHWRLLLLGQLTGDEAAPLERHLEGCAACRAMVQGLKSGDFQLHGPGGFDGLTEVSERLRDGRATSIDDTWAGDLPSAGDTELFEFLDPPQGPDELGRVGRYRVLEVLGRGGMGVVFRCEGPNFKGPVAVKVIRSALALSMSARLRFRREAGAAAAVKHQHIVPVFEIGEDRGLPYLVMPLLRGETLEDQLTREGRLTTDDVLRVGREIASGLAAAHAAGLIHRDIKPANIWLEVPVGRVKILDFGLARDCDDAEPLSQIGAVSGTPAYMAPEQASGDEVDGRADLFSLGSLLYRAATGQPPFQGKNAAAVLLAVVRDETLPPVEINSLIPAELSALVMRLLMKCPRQRPPTAVHVVAEIERIERIRRPAAPEPPKKSLLGALLALVGRRLRLP